MLIFLLFIGFFVVRYVLVLRQYKRSSYYVVTRNSFFYVRSDKGRFGEYCTYLKLRDLGVQGGKFLFNVYIPTPNGTTEIDLLMICRRGIFVFESKNYSGWIFGKESQQKWTQTLPHGRGSHKEHFYNPILQNKGHLQALQNYIGAEVPLWSIIVFFRALYTQERSGHKPKHFGRQSVRFAPGGDYAFEQGARRVL